MNIWDWFVIIFYIVIIIGFAFYLTRKQFDIHHYYLAGKKIKWWQSGMSTMATQLGAISFVSAPAFVALKEDGGLKWLCYEFGVPLALILVMAIIIPILHTRNYISIYEYLEERFDSSTRLIVSILFQLGRGLATAVSVLAGGLILSTALSIPTSYAIILVGIATLIYDVLGGIKVVILSDVLQMMIIFAGIIICGGVALNIVGWESSWMNITPARVHILDFTHFGFSAEETYSFWPMTIGGFFLYVSYYGCDQSQVQRELTVGTIHDVKKSLLVNALGRFPLVFLYCLMGILVGAVLSNPAAMEKVALTMDVDTNTVHESLKADPDRMLPFFILSFLPHGVIGFIFVAIMAALMSSLDSGLNSLSAVTMRDIYQKYINHSKNNKHNLIVSKLITLFWGLFCIIAALLFLSFGEATRQTTIVLINAVGSLLYGPILAAFILGILFRKVNTLSVKLGIITGIIVNIYFWLFTPVSWLWWNFIGFFIAIAASSFIYLFNQSSIFNIELNYASLKTIDRYSGKWSIIYILLIIYFMIIIFLCYIIERIALY
jgi:sodium-dependent multivitamin transporter 6